MASSVWRFLVLLIALGAARAEDEACTCDAGPSDYESLGSPVRPPATMNASAR